MKAVHVLLFWMALLLVIPSALWAQEYIKLQSIAEMEKEVFNAEGKKEIQRVPAAKVMPGSEVIFTTSYENVSKENAEDAVITNPIPEHMIYTDGSAEGAGTRITFSMDNGKSYNIPTKLFFLDAAGRKFPARPKDYTHIRWAFTNPLPSGAKGIVSFRAILK